jgi:hypothetical protein
MLQWAYLAMLKEMQGIASCRYEKRLDKHKNTEEL